MRLWEEEKAERTRKRNSGVAASDSSKRNKVNVRPSVRRIGDPKVTKELHDTASSPSSASHNNDWKPLHVETSPTRKNERWMSTEQNDECGVEVECTVAATHKRRLTTLDINQPQHQGSTKSTSKLSGLLKHRRHSII